MINVKVFRWEQQRAWQQQQYPDYSNTFFTEKEQRKSQSKNGEKNTEKRYEKKTLVVKR